MRPTEKIKIALVDDHNLFRKGILELLNGFKSYTVMLEAENGKDFIQKLDQENLPNIVLLDINMPVMDGFETAKWLQKRYPEVKILCLTMNDDEQIVLRMLKCGVDGYVLKNAEPDELKKALETVTAEGSYYADIVNEALKKDLSNKKQSAIELTDRETDFLKLACTELPYKAFAPFLKISPRVVEATRDILFKKLDVTSRVGLVMYALRNGISKIE